MGVSPIRWRKGDGHIWHGYWKRRRGVYHSLCGRHHLPVAGDIISRPPEMVRCVQCDLREIAEHGADGSLPATVDAAGRDVLTGRE